MRRAQAAVRHGRSITGAVLALILSGCATGPKPSDVILARAAPPLLDTEVGFQRMPIYSETTDRLDMPAYPRRLVVTATELTMPGGNGNEATPWEFTLSFAIVESVEVKTVEYEPLSPFGKPRPLESAVVITEKRGICHKACVFVFGDPDGTPDAAMAKRFADIVRAGQAIVDPYGRDDGPRHVWTAIGLRSPRPGWSPEIREADDATRSAARTVETAVFGYAKDALRADLRECMMTTLNGIGESRGLPGWSYDALPGVAVKSNTELDVGSVTKAAQSQTGDINSLLVSDVYGLGFTYIPPIDSEPAQVETKMRAYVDFYDLEPLKDGAYFWYTHVNRRELSGLTADPVGHARDRILELCAGLAGRIAEEISRNARAGGDRSGH